MSDGDHILPDPVLRTDTAHGSATPDSAVRARQGAGEDKPKAGESEPGRRRAARRLGMVGSIVAMLLVAAGAWGYVERRDQTLDVLAQEHGAVPIVRTLAMAANDAPRTIDLPATLQPFDSATLFARATGYIAKRNVDIGSRIHAGDVLAVIAAPDLDQQLAQARAQLAQTNAALSQSRAALQQAQANQDLADVTNRRYSQLAAKGYAAQQDADNARLSLAARNADVRNSTAAVDVADANVKAQEATVSRLEQLAGFEQVTAPFDGVVTARQIDVGDLVTADASSGTPMFAVARTNVLRVQVYVPQDAVFGLKDGDAAQVLVPEMPGRIFRGVVARNASELQAGTRTLLTEIDIDNADGTLNAGLYGTVRLSVVRQEPVFSLPSTAVVFDKNGLSAAVYENGAAHLRHLDVAEDDGAQVIVRAGIKAGDRVIVNPPVDLTDDMRVAAAEDGQQPAQSRQAAANTSLPTLK
jgi:RND family efflux transporter MFP subunit